MDDVKPYEFMKLRLLNGGHSCLSYMSVLCGYNYVDDAMADPLISSELNILCLLFVLVCACVVVGTKATPLQSVFGPSNARCPQRDVTSKHLALHAH